MGLCGSSMSAEDAAEKGNDKKVDQVLRDQQAADARINKLLLLGAGASGKSTLFKQMINIYGKGFPEAERKTYTNIIYNNVLTAMKTLCLHSSRFGEVSPDLAEGKALIESDLKEDQPVDEVLGAHIKSLWLDPAIQETFQHQAEFQLNDSAKYFFDQIDTIATMGYIPSEQDVLHARAPTTGIVENHFEIDGNAFKMFDVGGQRNERKKWIHCFENVTAVLFVAALSEYNQVLYEDECLRVDEPVMLATGKKIAAGQVHEGMLLAGTNGPVQVLAPIKDAVHPESDKFFRVTLEDGHSYVVKTGHKITLINNKNPLVEFADYVRVVGFNKATLKEDDWGSRPFRATDDASSASSRAKKDYEAPTMTGTREEITGVLMAAFLDAADKKALIQEAGASEDAREMYPEILVTGDGDDANAETAQMSSEADVEDKSLLTNVLFRGELIDLPVETLADSEVFARMLGVDGHRGRFDGVRGVPPVRREPHASEVPEDFQQKLDAVVHLADTVGHYDDGLKYQVLAQPYTLVDKTQSGDFVYRPLASGGTVRVVLMLHNGLRGAPDQWSNKNGSKAKTFINLESVFTDLRLSVGDAAGVVLTELNMICGDANEIDSTDAKFDACIQANMLLTLDSLQPRHIVAFGGFNYYRWRAVAKLAGVSNVAISEDKAVFDFQPAKGEKFQVVVHFVPHPCITAHKGAIEAGFRDLYDGAQERIGIKSIRPIEGKFQYAKIVVGGDHRYQLGDRTLTHNTQNRMVESLQLFDEICNSRWFRETSMILFLNKRDVFAEKIEQHPLADWFPEFAVVGSNTFEAAAGWIKEQFEIRNLDPASKTIYTHVTCATDTSNVMAVFSAVKDIILRKNLGKVGLL